jgi:hypothetical protein
MTFSIEKVRLDGCILEPSSPKAYRARFEDGPVPDQMDLRPYCTPVEDQGQIGSCTANATVGALEYHLYRRDGYAPDLSRMFVYYNTRKMIGTVPQDSGATVPQAMASVLAFGACREEIWPYDPALFAREPPPPTYVDAKRYEAVHYARVEDDSRVIRAVAEGLPVVFGTFIPKRCYDEAARTGVVPQPTEEERRAAPRGGHCMLIVGYDRHAQTFLVRNSWGTEWGDGGYCRIPFDVIGYFSPPDQFWVIGQLEQPGHFTLIRPQDTVVPSHAGVPEMRIGGIADTAARMREQIRAGLESDIGAVNAQVDALLAGSRLRTRTGAGSDPGTQVCELCGGSGKCHYCRGSGRYLPDTTCSPCKGTGQCNACGGTGKLRV